MPLFSSTWFANNRDPAFASAAGATAAVVFALLVVYRQQKRIAASQRSGVREIPIPKQQYPFFGTHFQIFSILFKWDMSFVLFLFFFIAI